MGYYTYFKLETKNDDGGEAKEWLKEKSGYSWFGDDLEDSKWYNWEKDVHAAQDKFPDVTFIIEGCGEDAPDFWKYWGRGDKTYYDSVRKITFMEPGWI